MDLRKIILVLSITLLSSLSYAQTDSLFGKAVTVHLHETKKTVIGEYRSYKDNRITVLFDNGLHDYFYPNIEFLSFEEFNVRFTEKGVLTIEKTATISSTNLSGITTGKNHLILQNNKNSKIFVFNLDKKIKVRLKNYDVIKTKSVEILDESTLKFNSRNFKKHTIVDINDVIQIQGYKTQQDEITALGQVTTIVGIITIPYLIGIPIIIASKYVKGYRSKYLDKWSLKIS